MKINTIIPTQSSFPRKCPEFQPLFLLILSVAYDAIHMMSSQSVNQQLAAVYCASRVEARRPSVSRSRRVASPRGVNSIHAIDSNPSRRSRTFSSARVPVSMATSPRHDIAATPAR